MHNYKVRQDNYKAGSFSWLQSGVK